ncbi:MAG: hypothetical protein GXY74_12335 [Phycisphaerae bacterium]|nr:hypothetical protein [Phycisphaerae bacterium]
MLRTTKRAVWQVSLVCALASATAGADEAKEASAPAPAEALASLSAETARVAEAHRQVYLGDKGIERLALLPAALWHMGEAISTENDLACRFNIAHALGYSRDPKMLQQLLDTVNGLSPKAGALQEQAQAAAEAARALAGRVAKLSPTEAEAVSWPDADVPDKASELQVLLGLTSTALKARPASPAVAAACLAELAGRLDHLADLDRWLALECQFVRQAAEWVREPGVAPRTLCYSFQSRLNEAAALQSRVEDILLATEAERRGWTVATGAATAGDDAAATAGEPTLAAMKEEVARLREADVAMDRDIAALAHERKIQEVIAHRNQKYVPLVAKLEHLSREAAVMEWTEKARRTGDNGRKSPQPNDGLDAQGLSLTARAGLARVMAEVPPAARKRAQKALADMLRQPYLASYVDLCFYQAAVMETHGGLATRIAQSLAMTSRPDTQDLMQMLHPTPGAMTTADRSDNAYQPQILQWASQCRGSTAEDRMKEAHALTHAFYKAAGYNANQPVSTLRDVLESKLVDCIAGCQIQGAIAATAGVTGIVPVRYWKDKLGHTLIGFRKGDRVVIMDPLGGPATRPFPGGYPQVITVETGAPSFGGYVVDAVEIVSTGKVLRCELPYLKDEAGRRQKKNG